MTPFKDVWLAHQRKRWLRHDVHRWIRHDAHRFLPPGHKYRLQSGFDPLDFILLLEGKANFNRNQPRVPKGNPDGGQWTEEETGGARQR